jgi:hypothetical protein
MINCFIQEIINNDKINFLIRSNYGNYVIQKALKIANVNNKLTLINNILQNLEKLGDKKLMIKWKHIVDSTIEECMRANQMIYGFNNFSDFSVMSGNYSEK